MGLRRRDILLRSEAGECRRSPQAHSIATWGPHHRHAAASPRFPEVIARHTDDRVNAGKITLTVAKSGAGSFPRFSPQIPQFPRAKAASRAPGERWQDPQKVKITTNSGISHESRPGFGCVHSMQRVASHFSARINPRTNGSGRHVRTHSLHNLLDGIGTRFRTDEDCPNESPRP